MSEVPLYRGSRYPSPNRVMQSPEIDTCTPVGACQGAADTGHSC